MQTVYVLCFSVSLVALILVSAIQLRRSGLSRFELALRKKNGSQAAAQELERELMLGDVTSLQKALTALLLVANVLLAVNAFGWLTGIFVGVVVALTYGRVAFQDIVQRWASRLYKPYDKHVTNFIKQRPIIGKVIRSVSPDAPKLVINSAEELEHIVQAADKVLTADERKLIVNGLNFDSKTVQSIITPRSVVKTIDKSELLGPLALDDLHRTGHSRFPVTNGDIDHIVGVLHIRDLLIVGDKESLIASQAMEKRVHFIHQDQHLDRALAAFLKTRHHLFVVLNDYRETVGIITLEDVVEALLGRKIADEFDTDDDMRTLAASDAKSNNNSPHGVNL